MTAAAEPAADPQRIDAVLSELRRVWKRNPSKTLSQVVARAQSAAGSFIPTDATDDQVLAGLRNIGPGLPAPE